MLVCNVCMCTLKYMVENIFSHAVARSDKQRSDKADGAGFGCYLSDRAN